MEHDLKAAYDMIYLVSCAVNGKKADADRVKGMDLAAVRAMSRGHSLSSAVYFAAEEAELGEEYAELLQEWEKEQLYVIYRESAFDCEREAVFEFCEQNKIWYMPLKGIILKDYYPHAGMRQMGDNDILFDEKFRRQMRKRFENEGYEVELYDKCNHDAYRKGDVMFEMHTELFGPVWHEAWREGCMGVCDYYADVKERLIADKEGGYGYHFTDEDFYIHLTAHEYKHYVDGGAGLRAMLDRHVFLRAKGASLDWKYIDNETKKLGIDDFERENREMSEKVFGGEGIDEARLTEKETARLREILCAGTYGTAEVHIRNQIERLGGGEMTRAGKMKYLWSRLFPDIEMMRAAYPICRCTPLIPVGYAYRLVMKGITNVKGWTGEVGKVRRM